MAALTTARATPIREGRIVNARVGASTTIHQGALLEISAGGQVSPATKAVNKTYWGIALESITTGAGETGTIEVRHGAVAHFAGGADLDTDAEKLAALGDNAHPADDQTMLASENMASACGVIVDFDAAGVWVRLTN